MTLIASAKNLLQQGRLDDALAAATADVKSRPSDPNPRWLLAEILCFTGNLDRADLQLDVLLQQNPAGAVGLTLFRQLIRAEQARHQFYSDGRLPEFLEQPTPILKSHLEASTHFRASDPATAAQILSTAESLRSPTPGLCNGNPFSDLRDLDDLSSSHLELFAGDGKYYWLPFTSIQSLTFDPPQRPRDLLWRKSRIITHTGPEGDVYIPALYPNSHADPDPSIRLGRSTSWDDLGPISRGRGLRTFLVGDADLTIFDLKSLTFPEAQP